MTVRLDEDTARELAELAQGYRSRSAAVQAAIHQAWERLQAEKLDLAYAQAVAVSPNYPYESDLERTMLRARRKAREQR
jgi:metal-responsive CopG/Arc/MetJ family transcriptional regulator